MLSLVPSASLLFAKRLPIYDRAAHRRGTITPLFGLPPTPGGIASGVAREGIMPETNAPVYGDELGVSAAKVGDTRKLSLIATHRYVPTSQPASFESCRALLVPV